VVNCLFQPSNHFREIVGTRVHTLGVCNL